MIEELRQLITEFCEENNVVSTITVAPRFNQSIVTIQRGSIYFSQFVVSNNSTRQEVLGCLCNSLMIINQTRFVRSL